MSAAADARGLKRICTDCGTRFYDFNKRPITCPSCETQFTGEIKAKSRRGRAAIEEAEKAEKATAGTKKKELANDEIEITDADTISLDDVEEVESDDDEDLADLDSADLDELDVLEDDLDEDDLAEDLDVTKISTDDD